MDLGARLQLLFYAGSSPVSDSKNMGEWFEWPKTPSLQDGITVGSNPTSPTNYKVYYMNVPKQIIVMRKDLNMRKGKMCAQAAHASMAAILVQMEEFEVSNGEVHRNLVVNRYSALNKWLSGKFTKICVSVNSEQELVEIYKKAKEAGILCSLIEDSGATEFNGVPTLTCCAIGPDYPENIDPITSKLPLL